jgi:methyl-accepting chemotaxis protein
MNALWNQYLNLTIKIRLAVLCVCYSVCIVATAVAQQTDSALLRYGSIVLFILLGAIFGYVNIASITNSLDRASGYLQRMASGDLSTAIDIRRNNEISRMLRAMQELQCSIQQIIAGIQLAANHLAGASQQLLTTSAQITSGTDRAAAQSEAVTTAVDELASVSASISQNCQQMEGKTTGTERATRAGAETIASMTTMMGEIERMVVATMEAVKSLGATSDRIGDIVVAIEDIADQTNLLALNAAIEAARAGDQGRGFAVVADEVRGLAERTSTSTREIQTIIGSLQGEVKKVVTSMEQSARSVQNGSKDVQHSSEAIGEIRSHIAQLVENVSQVATAAEEQSATTAQIFDSMRNISQVVHDAAGGAHRTEQAAAELASSAAQLQQLANRFKLS